MYDRAKNQTLSLFCFRDKVDLEILQSDWQRTFLPISPGTRFFSSMGFVQEYSK